MIINAFEALYRAISENEIVVYGSVQRQININYCIPHNNCADDYVHIFKIYNFSINIVIASKTDFNSGS